MERSKIKQLLSSPAPGTEVLIKGWVRTRRDAKTFSFIEVNDGSCLKNIQVVADASLPNYSEVSSLATGSAVEVTGTVVPSAGKEQPIEVKASSLSVIGKAPGELPPPEKAPYR